MARALRPQHGTAARRALIEAARLPAAVSALLVQACGGAPEPTIVLGAAFDSPTPGQQSDFLAALRARRKRGARLRRRAGRGRQVRRVVLDAPRNELEVAARWARAGSRPPARALACHAWAVRRPDLQQRRAQAQRLFGVLGAGLLQPLAGRAAGPPRRWSMPALAILELAPARWPSIARAGWCARPSSPARSRARRARAPRCGACAAWRRRPSLCRGCARLISQARAAARPRLRPPRRAPRCHRRRRSRAQRPRLAARVGAALHDAARCRRASPASARSIPTSTRRCATGARCSRTLATLGSVAGRWRGGEARSRLRAPCAETVFQPKSGERAGAGAGPARVRRPRLRPPLGVRAHRGRVAIAARAASADSRRAAAPRRHPAGSPERSLGVDAALTRGWRGAAPEVVFAARAPTVTASSLPSPLVADVEASAARRSWASRRSACCATRSSRPAAQGRGHPPHRRRRPADARRKPGDRAARASSPTRPPARSAPSRTSASTRARSSGPSPGLGAAGPRHSCCTR